MKKLVFAATCLLLTAWTPKTVVSVAASATSGVMLDECELPEGPADGPAACFEFHAEDEAQARAMLDDALLGLEMPRPEWRHAWHRNDDGAIFRMSWFRRGGSPDYLMVFLSGDEPFVAYFAPMPD